MKENNTTSNKIESHKTLRMSVFESNSSSSHSITIETKGKKTKQAPLIEDNVLYPTRLHSYTTSFGESSATVCDDVNKKAAIVANWIRSFFKYDSYEDINEKMYLDYLKEKLGCKDINFEGKYCEFTHCSEYDGGLEFDDDHKSNIERLDYLIKVIYDDTLEIIDSDIAY